MLLMYKFGLIALSPIPMLESADALWAVAIKSFEPSGKIFVDTFTFLRGRPSSIDCSDANGSGSSCCNSAGIKQS